MNSETTYHYVTQINQNPIFVVGFPRSGTTLLQSLLATQDNVYSFPETHFFSLIERVKIENGVINAEDVDAFIELLKNKNKITSSTDHLIRTLHASRRLTIKLLFEIIVVSGLENQIDLERISSVRWLEKTPGHVFYLDRIYALYPSAKTIYINRNPENAIPSFIKYSKIWDRSKKHIPIEMYAKMWLAYLDTAERFQSLFPNLLTIVRLEDLIENTTGKMMEICKFANIEFNGSKLKRRKELASKLVHDWEYWKNDSLESEISGNIANKRRMKLTEFERIRMINLLKEKMELYNYNTNVNTISKNKIYDPDEILRTLAFCFNEIERKEKELFNEIERKEKELNEERKKYTELMIPIEELIKIDFFKSPLKKYHAYRKLVITYLKQYQST